jgi:hypothetical protein
VVLVVSSSKVPAGNEETSKRGGAKVIEGVSFSLAKVIGGAFSLGKVAPGLADWQSAGQSAVTQKEAAANADSNILPMLIERVSKPDHTSANLNINASELDAIQPKTLTSKLPESV